MQERLDVDHMGRHVVWSTFASWQVVVFEVEGCRVVAFEVIGQGLRVEGRGLLFVESHERHHDQLLRKRVSASGFRV